MIPTDLCFWNPSIGSSGITVLFDIRSKEHVESDETVPVPPPVMKSPIQSVSPLKQFVNVNRSSEYTVFDKTASILHRATPVLMPPPPTVTTVTPQPTNNFKPQQEQSNGSRRPSDASSKPGIVPASPSTTNEGDKSQMIPLKDLFDWAIREYYAPNVTRLSSMDNMESIVNEHINKSVSTRLDKIEQSIYVHTHYIAPLTPFF